MSMPIAILAGGFATRLHPITKEFPKSLIPINGYPFIGWQLRLLAMSGIRDVVLCLGFKARDISKFVGNGRKFGLSVEYSLEECPLGTGGALKKAGPLLGDEFGLLYGDSYLPINYLRVFEKFRSTEKLVLMTIHENRDRYDLSNVQLRSDKSLYYSKSKKTHEMSHIDYGFSVIRKKSLSFIPTGTPSDLSETFEELSRVGEIEGLEIKERFYEIGSFRGIVELERFLGGNSK